MHSAAAARRLRGSLCDRKAASAVVTAGRSSGELTTRVESNRSLIEEDTSVTVMEIVIGSRSAMSRRAGFQVRGYGSTVGCNFTHEILFFVFSSN
ncbi:hypothetical protein EVAR_15714_1 [Eumeta japonica]|uniref:Uncharacterized protein n=1 Tax=Eumeta variegata TaxID=151549 RepID=A0A4C1UAA4_EUMVA|nr:hypothetical protein EVAR_15714_1 [Eumeta japonica]